jgi:hypothetical protein
MNQVRVQILLEPRQHSALKQAAKQANKSMSELIRQMQKTSQPISGRRINVCSVHCNI